MEQVRLLGTLSKLDDDKHLAFGWAYVTHEDGKPSADHSGDFVDKAALPALEDAAYDFVLVSREADDMHVKLDDVAKLVESVMLTPEKAEAMGLVTKRFGWWVGFHVADEDVWSKIKAGERSQFSISGVGDREQVAA